MGQARLRKVLPEGIPHDEVFIAYKHWHAYCDYEGVYGNAAKFEHFLGCEIDWHRDVMWCHPRIAAKIHMLNSPHYYTLIKAYYARKWK